MTDKMGMQKQGCPKPKLMNINTDIKIIAVKLSLILQ